MLSKSFSLKSLVTYQDSSLWRQVFFKFILVYFHLFFHSMLYTLIFFFHFVLAYLKFLLHFFFTTFTFYYIEFVNCYITLECLRTFLVCLFLCQLDDIHNMPRLLPFSGSSYILLMKSFTTSKLKWNLMFTEKGGCGRLPRWTTMLSGYAYSPAAREFLFCNHLLSTQHCFGAYFKTCLLDLTRN